MTTTPPAIRYIPVRPTRADEIPTSAHVLNHGTVVSIGHPEDDEVDFRFHHGGEINVRPETELDVIVPAAYTDTGETALTEAHPRTEMIPATTLRMGILILGGGYARHMVANTVRWGGEVHCLYVDKTTGSFPDDTYVTVLAESLPSAYWVAQYEQLTLRLTAVADTLEQLGHDHEQDATDPPAVRAAHAQAYRRSAAMLRVTPDPASA